MSMPRDYHRLAAPAVFCSSVSRTVRCRSPVPPRRSPLRFASSRQRERLPEDREYEYDDYAAEIASYNRLRRGNRNAASSASITSRHTHEPYYDSTTVTAPQSNTYYYTSHFDTDDHQHVGIPAYRSGAPYVSDHANLHGISRLDYDDHQHQKHRKKRRHHHCHSRNSMRKHSENSSSDRPPRDTVAALKALANYGDTNHCASSVRSARLSDSPRKVRRNGSCERKSPGDTDCYLSSMRSAHHCDSPRTLQQKGSCERKSSPASCKPADEVITVTVDTRSSPVVDSSKDNLSLGECSDDDDDDGGVGDVGAEPVDMQTVQKSLPPRSSPQVTHSEHSCASSVSTSNCVTTAVSSGESTKTVYSDITAHQTEDSSSHIHHTSQTACIPSATVSTEGKADLEQLPTKRDGNTADHRESRSAIQLKRTPDNKEPSAVDDGSNKTSDEKRDTHRKSQSFRARRNYRKKSATDDERQTDVDDAPFPRFVVHFCS